MSLRHSILGLLDGRPLTGYEIKKIFDDTLAHAWNAHDSQIYPELHRMEEQGLAEVSTVTDGRRPRKVYAITEAGKAELQRWLESRGGNRITRDEFLLRVFFFGLLDRDAQLVWLSEEEDRLQAELSYADEVVAGYSVREPKSERGRQRLRWQLACVELHVAQTTVRLEWIQATKKDLDHEDNAAAASARIRKQP